jgi:hypothetical protein
MSSQYDNSSGFTIAHYALDLNGDNSSVYANGVAAELDSSTNLPLSVSAWVNPDDYSESTLVFAFFNDIPFKQGPSVWWLTSRKFSYYDERTAAGFSAPSSFSGERLINKWHHVVLTIGSDQDGVLYVNGSSQATFSNAFNTGVLNQFIIGVDKDAGSDDAQRFDGKIDEVAVWNDELTQDEVTTIYNSGYTLDVSSNSGSYVSYTNLIGYYRFNEGSGTSLQDNSTNSNTGTITGGTWTTGSVSE